MMIKGRKSQGCKAVGEGEESSWLLPRLLFLIRQSGRRADVDRKCHLGPHFAYARQLMQHMGAALLLGEQLN